MCAEYPDNVCLVYWTYHQIVKCLCPTLLNVSSVYEWRPNNNCCSWELGLRDSTSWWASPSPTTKQSIYLIIFLTRLLRQLRGKKISVACSMLSPKEVSHNLAWNYRYSRVFEAAWGLTPYVLGVPGGLLNLAVFASLVCILTRPQHDEKPAFVFIANLALSDLFFLAAAGGIVHLHKASSIQAPISRYQYAMLYFVAHLFYDSLAPNLHKNKVCMRTTIKR